MRSLPGRRSKEKRHDALSRPCRGNQRSSSGGDRGADLALGGTRLAAEPGCGLCRFPVARGGRCRPLLILAAALASHQLGRGHVCLDLAATLADPAFALSLPPEGDADALAAADLPREVLAGLTLEAWLAALDCPVLVGDGAGDTPLVLTGGRLYLRRYWRYEQAVRSGIETRLAVSAADDISPESLRPTIEVLFPSGADGAVDWQKLACAIAARNRFAVITGGPGTGKTTTVVRLLGLLQAQALDGGGRALRIRLAAPTGKAAARLGESIAGAVKDLGLDALPGAQSVRAAIPTTVGTLHRLLGSRPDSPLSAPRRQPLVGRRAGDRRSLDGGPRDDGGGARGAAGPGAADPARRQGSARLGRGWGGARRALPSRGQGAFQAGDLRVVAARHRHRRRRGID